MATLDTKATPVGTVISLFHFPPQILKIQLPAGALGQPGNACGLGRGTPMYLVSLFSPGQIRLGKLRVSGIGTAIVNIHSVLPIASVPFTVPSIHRGMLRLQVCSPWARLIFFFFAFTFKRIYL